MRHSEMEQNWKQRLKHCRELGDERGATMCRRVLEDLEALNGEPEQGGYWGTSEAADYTGLSEAQMRKLCKADVGPFPGAVKRDNRWLIPKTEVMKYMANEPDESDPGGSSGRERVPLTAP